jgi:tyrosyl-tRNA synthetase
VTHILGDLQWRGLIAHSTDLGALAEALDAGQVTYYCGFDPTAPSLHIGNLVSSSRSAAAADRAPAAGASVGGRRPGSSATPSPRRAAAERARTSSPDWVNRIRKQIEPFLAFDGAERRRSSSDNLEWTASMSAIDLLRDVGKHFRVNRMLAKDG